MGRFGCESSFFRPSIFQGFFESGNDGPSHTLFVVGVMAAVGAVCPASAIAAIVSAIRTDDHEGHAMRTKFPAVRLYIYHNGVFKLESHGSSLVKHVKKVKQVISQLFEPVVTRACDVPVQKDCKDQNGNEYANVDDCVHQRSPEYSKFMRLPAPSV